VAVLAGEIKRLPLSGTDEKGCHVAFDITGGYEPKEKLLVAGER
jgi:hypothetical protein